MKLTTEELREEARFGRSVQSRYAPFLEQAADEIDRLRDVLRIIEDSDIETGETDLDWGVRLVKIARTALEGGTRDAVDSE